ncbi:MAG: amidohydrolase family protein, partial [bacterium]|nr:amidohydrolase family protein [bacterium]
MKAAIHTALVILLLAGTAPGEVKVLENFTLIDGSGGSPVRDAALVVVDGRIEYAGPKARMKAPVGAQRINLGGKYVIPGIINLHGHIGNVRELTQDPKYFTRDNVNRQLSTYASYGVTSVVSMGADPDLVYQLRAEQRAGRPSVARIFTAGRGFTGKAGYPTLAPGMKGVPFEVESAADVRRAMAQLADKRVDVIKVWVDDHLGREEKISMDLCRAIIESAHKYGIKVAAHIFYLEDAKALVQAGLDGLAHSVRDKPVDAELIALMKKRGAWQAAATLTREVSTFVYAKPHPFLDDLFFTRSVPASVLQTLKSSDYRNKQQQNPDLDKLPGFLETAKRNLKQLHDSGVNVGFGTDTGPPGRFSGYFEQWEMELMVELGMT